jgi:hypothetical protein
LSDNGAFLREPLTNELVDTVDSLQLTALGTMSFITGGLLHPPKEYPDRKKVQAVITLANTLVEQAIKQANMSSAGFTPTNIRALLSDIQVCFKDVACGQEDSCIVIFNTWQSLFLEASRGEQYRPTIQKLSRFAIAVLGGIVERNAQRLTRQTVGFLNLPSTLPAIARVLDFVPATPRRAPFSRRNGTSIRT